MSPPDTGEVERLGYVVHGRHKDGTRHPWLYGNGEIHETPPAVSRPDHIEATVCAVVPLATLRALLADRDEAVVKVVELRGDMSELIRRAAHIDAERKAEVARLSSEVERLRGETEYRRQSLIGTGGVDLLDWLNGDYPNTDSEPAPHPVPADDTLVTISTRGGRLTIATVPARWLRSAVGEGE